MVTVPERLRAHARRPERHRRLAVEVAPVPRQQPALARRAPRRAACAGRGSGCSPSPRRGPAASPRRASSRRRLVVSVEPEDDAGLDRDPVRVDPCDDLRVGLDDVEGLVRELQAARSRTTRGRGRGRRTRRAPRRPAGPRRGRSPGSPWRPSAGASPRAPRRGGARNGASMKSWSSQNANSGERMRRTSAATSSTGRKRSAGRRSGAGCSSCSGAGSRGWR